MVDIHHHLLWGLDDGARDLETSVAMARASVQDGVTAVVCTPHASGQYSFQPELSRERVQELETRLQAEGVALQIGLGCDFHLSYDNIQEALADPKRFAVNGHHYLMVEIPDYGVPKNLNETFYALQLAGLVPVLTHPERNPTLQADHARLADWMRGGVLVQVTGDSVTGKMGKQAERMAHQLLAKRWVHFLATDAHGVERRPPRLSEARDLVARKYGHEYARLLVETNPGAVFEGRPLSPMEEPEGLYEDREPQSWFKRFLGWGNSK